MERTNFFSPCSSNLIEICSSVQAVTEPKPNLGCSTWEPTAKAGLLAMDGFHLYLYRIIEDNRAATVPCPEAQKRVVGSARRVALGRAAILFALAPAVVDASPRDRWIALLEGPAVAEWERGSATVGSLAPGLGSVAEHAARLARQQQVLAARLESHGVTILGSSQLLLNALYFAASAEQAAAVRHLAGVVDVQRMKAYRLLAEDSATQLVRAPVAWSQLGGPENAGAGRRIAILDTGIDHTHPAFADPSLAMPPGFPRANREADLAFANNKVIVARSYVDRLVLGDRPELSRPDDLSPRDRNGHGTAAAMLAAGRRVAGPAAIVSGAAPRAYLGNYKIFGSPGINDVTFTNVVVAALEDAVRDEMDVVSLNLAAPADFGPLELCGPANARRPCDPLATAIQNASARVLVVVGAGNSGGNAANLPALGTVESPGTAPAALTVGAFTNAHEYFQSLRVAGAPAELQSIQGRLGNGPGLAGPLSAPLRDVRTTGDNGLGCAGYSPGALAGAFAVLQRGGCDIDLKVILAQRAGAVGVILLQRDGVNQIVPLGGLTGTGIPLFLIGSAAGQRLREFLQANPDRPGTIDPSFTQRDAPADEIAFFSSQGPSIGEFGIKPEVTATGTDLYAAVQNFDPNGPRFSADRYLSLQGTSVAAPLVAGAAALIRQRRPDLTPAQVKSALVNRANPEVTDFDSANRPLRARVMATGAGKLDIAASLEANLFVEPATISFGPVTSNPVTITRQVRIFNPATVPLASAIQVQARDSDPAARVTVDGSANPTFPPGTSTLIVRLSGARPAPGSYEGVILISAAGFTTRIPYWYGVGEGRVHNLISLGADNFLGFPGQRFSIESSPLLVKAVDRFGLPVANAAVRWTVVTGGGTIQVASERTDNLGVADAGVQLGPNPGEQAFQVEIGGVRRVIGGRAIPLPTIREGGVVDAATGRLGEGVAPGSYISIFGSGLSEFARVFTTPYLPISLSNISVSFDAPERRISLPGPIHFISPGQINVQVPWELRGARRAQVKVSLSDLSSAVVAVPLNDFSPGIFEYDDPASSARLAAALDGASRLVSGSNPARRGQPLQLFVNGLGRVTNEPPSGEPASTTVLSRTEATPEVTIGGRPATLLFSGLAPGNIGLYQVNVIVPEETPPGIQPLRLTIGGVSAPASQVPVQ